MLTPRKIGRRLRALLFKSRLERDLDDELNLHLEMASARYREQGMTAEAARRRARVEFGGIERVREETRDVRGTRPVEDFLRDLRLGIRRCLLRPGFTALLLGTLAIGVGGAAAIFGSIKGILLTPLPYRQPERIVAVWQHDRASGHEREDVSPANFLDWRERSQLFEQLVSMQPHGLGWLSANGPVHLPTQLVSEGFFELFGVAPLHGTTFGADEASRRDIVVLGYQLWRTRFGGDLDVIGSTLSIDGRPTLIAGVMPEGFAIPNDDGVWAPKIWEGWEARQRANKFYTVFGRLRDGANLEQAQAKMDEIAAQLALEHPRTNAESGIALVPVAEQMLGSVRVALLWLQGAVALVLAIVIGNVASMQLAQGTHRRPELALRGALGASRLRVLRELLAEQLAIAAVAAALGYALAAVALRMLRVLAQGELPRIHELRADGGVLAFAAAVALVAVVVPGLVPTLASGRRGPSLPTISRAPTPSRLVSRTQASLVVAQICFSLILLIAAGLLVRSFVSVLSVERGFRSAGVVAGAVQAWHLGQNRWTPFADSVIAALETQPGIEVAGMGSSLPLLEPIGAERGTLLLEGAASSSEEALPSVHFTVASPGYFQALEVPLRRGRMFDSRDQPGALPTALVSESFVSHYWPDQEPLGKTFTVTVAGRPLERHVVGVVGDVRRRALHEEVSPSIYLPHTQAATGAMIFVARGGRPESDLLRDLDRAVWSNDSELAIHPKKTMVELVGGSVGKRRFLLALLGGFAALALVLAAAGIFGVLSYATSRRVREIGVRMAFGANRTSVVAMVLGSSGALALAGIALGLLGAASITRLFATALYGVAPHDPLTFVVSTLVLFATALLAGAYPAWRAGTVDPVRALRAE